MLTHTDILHVARTLIPLLWRGARRVGWVNLNLQGSEDFAGWETITDGKDNSPVALMGAAAPQRSGGLQQTAGTGIAERRLPFALKKEEK
ncbi:hypothetical protein ACLI09_06550 [Flavobacterium sp. RHBU_24]|uniref:hypothetical protein n=1 Tax=Flavobacterium sp. RHBU_24 TaxID=3391185 RepID=UPI00398467BC